MDLFSTFLACISENLLTSTDTEEHMKRRWKGQESRIYTAKQVPRMLLNNKSGVVISHFSSDDLFAVIKM